jgi:AcrR family transcriptional regulator
VPSYHHGNLRAALIDTAVEQARAGGVAAVVLRDAARRTGVSHNAAYRHFADRDELVGEVAGCSMRALEDAMRARMADIPDEGDPGVRALLRLRETGRAYVHFALAEPGLFTTAFAAKGTPTRVGAYGALAEALDELVATGVLPPERRPGAELTCWAAVHGFATLVLEGPLRALSPADRERELDGLLDRVARGL